MNWSDVLIDDEQVLWQGRPAPRCFTFRNWIHSLFGLVILIAAIGWLIYGVHLGNEHQQVVYALIPVPFLLVGAWLAFGHLILARLEWEKVYYALTDRRLVAVRGLLGKRLDEIALADLIYFQLRPLGAELGTVRVQGRRHEQRLTVCCIEYPRQLTDRLEAIVTTNSSAPQEGSAG